MKILTPEQMTNVLKNMEMRNSPEINQAMKDAAMLVEGVSKDYCTPGKSPYYKAPYQDDTLANRLLAHMRDQITHQVFDDGDSIVATVFVRGSAQGEPWSYALPVHTGTYDYFKNPEGGEISSTGKVPGMKGMPPRPVIPDAISFCQRDISKIISKAVQDHLDRCVSEA
jgi:hypothetical protein